MSTVSVLKARGLHTSDNTLSAVPDGAMEQADNVVIQSKDVVESRRGHEHFVYTFGGGTDRSSAGAFYGDMFLLHYGDTKLARDNGSTFSPYSGSYAPADATLLRMKFAEAANNIYFNTSTGVKALESSSITATPSAAGVVGGIPSIPPGSGGNAFQTTGASGWMANNTQVAYRYVFGRIDTSGRVILGRPSGRYIATNTAGGTRDILANIGIPSSSQHTYPEPVTTSHFIRLYRSVAVATTVTPDDELRLAYESQLTSSQISAAQVAITDSQPESLLGEYLYTNANSGEGGIHEQNDTPPVCKDICGFQDRLWFANTTGKHRLKLSLFNATPSNECVVINGYTYLFQNGIAAWQVPLVAYTSGTDSLETIAQNLASSVSAFPTTNTVVAQFASETGDPGGQLLLEERNIGGSAFYAGASDPSDWSPALPTAFLVTSLSRTGSTVTITTSTAHGFTSGQSVMVAYGAHAINGLEFSANFPNGVKTIGSTPTSTTFTYTEAGTAITEALAYRVHLIQSSATSTNDQSPNGLCYSKLQRPESVPLLNYLRVGSKISPILRIIPLREKLYVFKTDGIYIVSGEKPFRVDLLDATARLVSPDSAVILNSQIYCLTTQGVVTVSEAGVGIISRPIERELLTLMSTNSAGVKLQTFGVAYESERLYILWTQSSGDSSSTKPTQAYVYNYITGTWVKWPVARTFGIVNPSLDLLYMGHTSTNRIWKERKTYTAADYQDEALAAGITAASGTSITLSGASATPTVGDRITQGSASALITAVNGSTLTVTLDAGSAAFVAGLASVFTAISCAVKWVPVHGGAPATAKHFREVCYHLRDATSSLGTATFSTELDTTTSSVTVASSGTRKNQRVGVPIEKARAATLKVGYTIREGKSGWALHGFSVEADGLSERSTR
jgi:hypothetical protein